MAVSLGHVQNVVFRGPVQPEGHPASSPFCTGLDEHVAPLPPHSTPPLSTVGFPLTPGDFPKSQVQSGLSPAWAHLRSFSPLRGSSAWTCLPPLFPKPAGWGPLAVSWAELSLWP